MSGAKRLRGFRKELHASSEGGRLFEPPVFWGGELRRSLSEPARAATRKRSMFATDISCSLQCVPR